MKKALLFVPLVGSLAVGCQEEKAVSPPNILFIVSEDNGTDLGCYGNKYVSTPNLDQLSAEGMTFRNAYVTYSVSSPSRGTILTGLYPHQNGQIGLATHKYRMYDGVKTLPKYMRELGYKTGCIGKVHVNPESEIPWDFRPGGLLNGANFGKKNMPEYAEQAMKFIRSCGDTAFYLQVNYPDAHFPVQKRVQGLPTDTVPENITESLPFVGINSDYLVEYTTNYYNCMNRLDEAVGILLDSIAAYDKENNTIIIYMSDHGAQFSRGKCSNYEAGLKVPFIIKWKDKIQPGTDCEKLVSSIDLLPTFINWAGGETIKSLPGKSLLPLLNNPDGEGHKYIFAGGAGSSPGMYYPRRSVRNDRFKLILNIHSPKENPHYQYYISRIGHFVAGTIPEEIEQADEKIQTAYHTWRFPTQYELYDLQNDPNEFTNLVDNPEYAKQLEELKTAMAEWQKETQDPFADPQKLKMIDEEMANVMITHPNRGYRGDKNFRWKYVDYFPETEKK